MINNFENEKKKLQSLIDENKEKKQKEKRKAKAVNA